MAEQEQAMRALDRADALLKKARWWWRLYVFLFLTSAGMLARAAWMDATRPDCPADHDARQESDGG